MRNEVGALLPVGCAPPSREPLRCSRANSLGFAKRRPQLTTGAVLVGLYFLSSVVAISAEWTSKSTIALLVLGPFATGILVVGILFVWDRIFYRPFLATSEQRSRHYCKCMANYNRITRYNLCQIVYILYLVLAIGAIPLVSLTDLEFSSLPRPNAFVAFAYNLFGSIIFLLMATIFVDVVYYTLAKCYSKAVTADLKLVHVHQWKSAVSLVAYLTITIVSLLNGYSAPLYTKVGVTLAGLPECLIGFRIALVSDLHAGPLIGLAAITTHVERINAFSPDIVVLAGDMADGPPSQLANLLKPLSRGLVAPSGIYFSTGNHEYGHGSTGEDWKQWWVSENVTLLDNRRVAVGASSSCTDTFDLIGVNDWSHGPNLTEAMSESDPGRASVLIAHQPSQMPEAVKLGVGLQLSGHTHGGHLFPMHAGIYALNEGYVSGAKVARGVGPSPTQTAIYVSQGITDWGPRTRLGSRNEVVVLTLYPGAVTDFSHGTASGDDTGISRIVLSLLVIVMMFVVGCTGVLRKRVITLWRGCRGDVAYLA